MKILQTYSIREGIFGDQEFNFLVSDDYAELFNADNIDITTDIFDLDTSKKDLEIEKLTFAIDEFKFKIRETSLRNEDDKNAMFFCLDATNIKIPRFVAVYMGAIAEGNLDFIGKLESKVNGNDIVHKRNEWSDYIGALREYSFTALSIDFALLEDADFEEVIRDADNSIVSNVYDRIKASSYSLVDAISESSLNYPIKLNSSHALMKSHFDNHKQVNLFNAINMYLDTANEILTALYGLEVEFSFGISDLGFSASPTKFELDFNGNVTTGHIKNHSADTTKNYKVKLSDEEYNYNDGDPYISLFVSRTVIDPEITKGLYSELQTAELLEEEILDYGTQNLYSWKKKYKNVAELLYNLARNFGCFIKKTMTPTSIQLEFVPRKDFNLNNSIRILGASQGSVDMSALDKSENIEFEEFANHLMPSNVTNGGVPFIYAEFVDKPPIEKGTLNKFTEMEWLITEKERLNKLKDNNYNIHLLPLSLSFSPVGNVRKKVIDSLEYNASGYNGLMTIMFNTVRRLTHPTIGKTSLVFNSNYNYNLYERLHTGVFMYCQLPEHGDYADGTAAFLTVKRPIRQINIQIAGENLTFTNFNSFLKYIEDIEKKQYETTYTLKVPFWNAFAVDGDGMNPSWKNAELGTNVRLTEYVTRYIEEEFNESLIENDFTIVSIERNFKTPETTIKLSLKSRFAYGYNDSESFNENGGSGPTYPEEEEGFSEVLTSYDKDYTSTRTYVIEDSETIEIGDAVSILANGKVIKTESDSDQESEILGICLNVFDDIEAEVLLSGIVRKEGWSWAGIGDYVFARTNVSSNLSQTILDTPNSTEDLMIVLGKVISEKEIFVNPFQLKYEDGKTS